MQIMTKIVLKISLFCMLLLASASVYGEEAKKDTTLVGRLEFVVNTANVIENEEYRYFVDTLLPAIKNNKERVTNVIVVGSASPEGRKDRNLYLEKIRAQKACSYLKDVIEDDKVFVMNSSEVFLYTSKCKEEDWDARRGTFVKVWFKGEIIKEVEHKDTVLIRDTVYHTQIDTIYLEKPLRRIPILGVKTNLLSDVIAAPNVQAELYTHLKGVSLEFSYTFPWWYNDDIYAYYQVLNGTAGVRKYFKDNYLGHYIGAYGNTAIYDICYDKEKGYQGEVHGCGLSYGYVFANRRHPRLKFEFYARAGWLYTRFDTYHAGNPFAGKYYYNWYKKASDFVPRRFEMNYFGPTALGFNITYDLICLRRY